MGPYKQSQSSRMKTKLPNIAPTIAPITVLELGSVEPAAVMGAGVWAAGAGVVMVTGLATAVVVVVTGLVMAMMVVATGLAIGVVVVVTGLTIDVVVVAAGLAIGVVDGLGVAAGSVPARRRVVVNVV
jgi:hypothetical protein